jgi:feruloyl esterase
VVGWKLAEFYRTATKCWSACAESRVPAFQGFMNQFPARSSRTRRFLVLSTVASLAICGDIAAAQPVIRSAADCEALRSVPLAAGTVSATEFVPAGPYRQPGAAVGSAPPERALLAPAHCRVGAILRPAADSEIEIALWLPADTWNGRFVGIGNGAWGGVINYQGMLFALQNGYAAASTDTGHRGQVGAAFAIGHPEKLVDFGHRAVHEMVAASKALIRSHYREGPRFSYWDGCSTGGRQGLAAAQRYPADFDGILAGAPAIDQPRIRAADLAAIIPTLVDPTRAVPQTKLDLLNKSAINACDAADGVKDGVITDPRTCKFDPAPLACGVSAATDCLTPRQLETIRQVYAPAVTRTGELVAPGKWPGSENGWQTLTGATPPPQPYLVPFQIVHGSTQWDWRQFTLDSDLAAAEQQVGAVINAASPDLSAFKARGGKLLLYHGMADESIPPANTINYHSQVLDVMGRRQDAWFRLFLVPGMMHCGGGAGANQANYLAALERWRESGEKPDRILAVRVTGNRVEMTRPICPYPKLPRYNGRGSTNDSENFECRAP